MNNLPRPNVTAQDMRNMLTWLDMNMSNRWNQCGDEIGIIAVFEMVEDYLSSTYKPTEVLNAAN